VMPADRRSEQVKGTAKLAHKVVLVSAQQKRIARGGLLPGHPIDPQFPSIGDAYGEVEGNLIDIYVTRITIIIVPKEREVELTFAKSASRKGVKQPCSAKHSRGPLSLSQIAVMFFLRKRSNPQHKQQHDKRAYLSSRFHYFAS